MPEYLVGTDELLVRGAGPLVLLQPQRLIQRRALWLRTGLFLSALYAQIGSYQLALQVIY